MLCCRIILLFRRKTSLENYHNFVIIINMVIVVNAWMQNVEWMNEWMNILPVPVHCWVSLLISAGSSCVKKSKAYILMFFLWPSSSLNLSQSLGTCKHHRSISTGQSTDIDLYECDGHWVTWHIVILGVSCLSVWFHLHTGIWRSGKVRDSSCDRALWYGATGSPR